jgi:hypothetical protein
MRAKKRSTWLSQDALGNAGLFGDGAHAPMCFGLGFASERFSDQLSHRLVLDRAGPAATHLVVKPLDPIGNEAIAPFADRMGPTPSRVATTALLG